MPPRLDPRSNENPNTYFVQDRANRKELTRLAVQDQMLTAGMGGVLPEQADPTLFRRMLDVGCGTGGWLIEAAQTYPTMSLVGIDISRNMIEYARAQAEAGHVHDRVEFAVMDALLILDFPTAFFDLVNLRLSSSFMRKWDWPKLLSEMLRVTGPSGVVRVTECETPQSNSPAFTQLCAMGQCALYRAGHFFTQESTGLTDHLPRLLKQHGCHQVQTKVYTLQYRAGTPEGEAFYEDWTLLFQTLSPFIQKWGCASKDYEVIYQQALDEMQQPDFHATWNLLTVWGSRSSLKAR